MEPHLQHEIDKLHLTLLEMAAHVDKAVENAQRSLLERDADLAQQVIDEDKVINGLECQIDADSLRLLALTQPMARDLRLIVGIMRITGNLERLGDEAVNISERSMLLALRPPLPFHAILQRMCAHSMEMLRSAIKALKDEDVELAEHVCAMDTSLNEQDILLLRKLIDYMLKDTPAIERSVHTILVSRSLERIGDLSQNIAEIVIFITRGVDIKHHCGRI